MLAAKLESPLYAAVMVCEPTARVLTVIVGVEMETVPRLVAPSKNVTVPLGVPAPGGITETIAVKVTDWPSTDGFTEELTVVLVDALFTVWVIGLLVLGTKLPSPLYVAVIECDPAVSIFVAKVARPELTVPVPKVVPPSRKVTVPDGFPDAVEGIKIDAVNVTDWPYTDGFCEDATVIVVGVNAFFMI